MTRKMQFKRCSWCEKEFGPKHDGTKIRWRDFDRQKFCGYECARGSRAVEIVAKKCVMCGKSYAPNVIPSSGQRDMSAFRRSECCGGTCARRKAGGAKSILVNGVALSLAELAEIANVTTEAIWYRLKRGRNLFLRAYRDKSE